MTAKLSQWYKVSQLLVLKGKSETDKDLPLTFLFFFFPGLKFYAQ